MLILYDTLYKIVFLLLFFAAGYWIFVRLGIRKYFPLLLIIALGGSIYLFSPAKEAPPPLTQEQKQALIREQMIISEWYTAYKKDIDQIDLNWQQYHKTLHAFKNDIISIQTIYVRFFELQKKTAAYRSKYETALPPAGLSLENEALVAAMTQKTRKFAAQQDEVLQKSVSAIAPKNLKTSAHEEQIQLLDRIMILDSPESLDIAPELVRIRENLTLPEDQG